MKKLHNYLAAILFICVTTGCSSENSSNHKNISVEEGSPSSVAIAFFTHLGKGQLEAAKLISTEPTHQVIDNIASNISVDPNYEIILIKDSIVNNMAFVTLKESNGDTLTPTHVVRIDKEWKVDIVSTAKAERKAKAEAKRHAE